LEKDVKSDIISKNLENPKVIGAIGMKKRGLIIDAKADSIALAVLRKREFVEF